MLCLGEIRKEETHSQILDVHYYRVNKSGLGQSLTVPEVPGFTRIPST